jgi:hypothetical protein
LDDLGFQNEMKLIIGNLISSAFGVLFSLLYIFFTFKNGLGKEIYHYACLTIEEIRNNRDEKRKEDIKNTINTLNEELVYLAPDEIDLEQGTPVRIIGSIFDGIEGTFVKVKKSRKKRVVVMVQGIAAVMLAEFTDGYLQVLK